MKNVFSKITLLLLFFLVFLPGVAWAHQPRMVESRLTNVPDPEISKAYYGQLVGQSDVYVINASAPFDLYVNVLVPDIVGQQKDVSVIVLKNGAELALLDGLNFEWKQFFEPFGYDTYWMGPEYKTRAEAGEYQIRVTSADNTSKYALAIGQLEAFDFKQTKNALTLIPKLKRSFFNESPAGFIFSPFGYGLILIMFALSFVFGLSYRALLKKFAHGSRRGLRNNIGKPDRFLRLALSLGLLILAITTTWSPLLLFFSGFCLFESLFSWCGLYSALGKNSCPIN